MEFNRNQFFMLGVVFILLGLQLRYVETYVFNEKASRIIAERTNSSGAAADSSSFMPAAGPTPRRTWNPPEWAGWALISVGAVLVLHSLAMKRP